MNKFLKNIRSAFSLYRYWAEEKAVAALEVAILFPVLLSLMMAVYDLGQGVVVNQKTISASQIIGDLIARNEIVDQALVEDIAIAGQMALSPYVDNGDDFGYDIISIQFDEDDEPEELWRVTNNMTADDGLIDRADGLGEDGEGVIIVSVVTQYTPFFTDFILDQIDMTEVSFLRGRKSSVISCTDCP
tara:strand:+ start:623 stop:1186 length:564 start_codon:yes stop_codon:yes gene_type:complete